MPYADPDKQREYQRKWMARRREEWLGGQVCLRCGSDDYLELHHLVPGEKVEHRVWSWTGSRRDAELEKCFVMCRLCHGEYHADSRKKHGVSRYRGGCRCSVCRQAKVGANRRYRIAAKASLAGRAAEDPHG